MRVFAFSIVLLAFSSLVACSSDSHSPAADAGRDSGPDPDTGPDAPPDPLDAGTDAGPGEPVGSACSAAAECEGPICVTPAMGFPDGYCTGTCDLADPLGSCAMYGGDAMCLMVGAPGMPMGAC